MMRKGKAIAHIILGTNVKIKYMILFQLVNNTTLTPPKVKYAN